MRPRCPPRVASPVLAIGGAHLLSVPRLRAGPVDAAQSDRVPEMPSRRLVASALIRPMAKLRVRSLRRRHLHPSPCRLPSRSEPARCLTFFSTKNLYCLLQVFLYSKETLRKVLCSMFHCRSSEQFRQSDSFRKRHLPMCSHGDAALLEFSLFRRPAPAMQIAKRKRQPSRGQAEREAAPASPTGSPLVWWRARRDSNARPPGPQPGGPPSHPGSWSSPPRPPASAPAAVTVAVKVAVRGGGPS